MKILSALITVRKSFDRRFLQVIGNTTNKLQQISSDQLYDAYTQGTSPLEHLPNGDKKSSVLDHFKSRLDLVVCKSYFK